MDWDLEINQNKTIITLPTSLTFLFLGLWSNFKSLSTLLSYRTFSIRVSLNLTSVDRYQAQSLYQHLRISCLTAFDLKDTHTHTFDLFSSSWLWLFLLLLHSFRHQRPQAGLLLHHLQLDSVIHSFVWSYKKKKINHHHHLGSHWLEPFRQRNLDTKISNKTKNQEYPSSTTFLSVANWYIIYITLEMPLSSRAQYPNIYLTIHIRPASYPDRYHWGIFVPHPPYSSLTQSNSEECGVNFHVIDYSQPPYWRYEADYNYNLNSSAYVAAAIGIGRLRRGMSVDRLHQLLSRIPMDLVPNQDLGNEPGFTCRVWVREAIRVLDRAGIIQCDSVDELEWELKGYGERARHHLNRGYFRGGFMEASSFSRWTRPLIWAYFSNRSELCRFQFTSHRFRIHIPFRI